MPTSSRIKLIGWSLLALLAGGIAIFASLMKESDIPGNIHDTLPWKLWISQPKNIFAVASAILAGIAAYQMIKQLKAPNPATEETASRIETDLKEIKRTVVGELDLINGFAELTKESVRRLPTALLVADYGIIPYDDALGSKAALLAWINNGKEDTAGRLLVAPGGYGKTRLALELVTTLRTQGWSAGFLPRSAFQQKDIRGDLDIDDQLNRFFQARGTRGALLVLDYAESRPADIERLAKAAARASKGAPIRLLLLARTAGDWWKDLHVESRTVQMVFEREPILEHGTSLPSACRETFFNNAAGAFAQRLSAADTEKDLLDPEWQSRPLPTTRLDALHAVSPLLLAFEAYLHVRGVASGESVLDEMGREEQRHWARALKFPPEDAGRSRNVQIEAVHRCASAITLIQGTDWESWNETLLVLDKVILIALRRGPPLAAGELEKANSLASIKTAVERLYLASQKDGFRLVPILPDLLGEHICAETLSNDPDLLVRLSELESLRGLVPFVVANRITPTQHDRRKFYAARRAIVNALPQQTDGVLQLLYDVGRYERGALVPALEEAVKELSDAGIERLLFAVAPNDPQAQRLIERLLREQVFRHLETGDFDESLVPADLQLSLISNEDIGGRLIFRTPDNVNQQEINTASLLLNAAQRINDFEEAAKWFDRAYKLFSDASRKSPIFSLQKALTSINHANSAWDHGAVDETMRLLKRAEEDISEIPRSEEASLLAASLTHAATASDVYVHSLADGNQIGWDVCMSALSLYQQASSENQGIVTELAIRVLTNATNIASNFGDSEAAIALGEWALRVAKRYEEADLGDIGSSTPLLVNICVNLSRAYFEVENRERALELSRQSVDLARDLNAYDPERYRFELGKALDGLAVDYLAMGDFVEAVTLEEEAISLLETSVIPSKKEDLAAALINETVALVNIGDKTRALDRLFQAQEIYKEILDNGILRFPQMLHNLRALEEMMQKRVT